MITENDVRLIRRILVALQFDCTGEADLITDYLRYVRDLNIVLPKEQTKEQRQAFMNRLLANEVYLAKKFGCILLPDYHDCIFLNSKWANPKTLYVRLVHPVEELGELGNIYWLPENKQSSYPNLAEANHEEYKKYVASLQVEKKSWWQKLLGR